jgi:hypothetical protein
MPGRIQELQVGGVTVLVETSPVAGTEMTSRLDRAQEAMGDGFAHARDTIVGIAESSVEMIDRLCGQTRQPEQVEVKFGLKFAANGGVIVAGVSGEASLEVTLTYAVTPATT